MDSMPQRTQRLPSREVTMVVRDSAFELCALVVDSGIFKKSNTDVQGEEEATPTPNTRGGHLI